MLRDARVHPSADPVWARTSPLPHLMLLLSVELSRPRLPVDPAGTWAAGNGSTGRPRGPACRPVPPTQQRTYPSARASWLPTRVEPRPPGAFRLPHTRFTFTHGHVLVSLELVPVRQARSLDVGVPCERAAVTIAMCLSRRPRMRRWKVFHENPLPLVFLKPEPQRRPRNLVEQDNVICF